MGGPVAPVKRGARGRSSSPTQMRAELAERLEGRRPEIEAAVMTRIHAIADPAETDDPEYVEGLRAAVSAAVDYGVATVELGEERAPVPPPALLVQARMAARAGVSLDTVLRRYFAGYTLLGDFLMEEAEAAGLRGPMLKRVLRAQAVLFDRLLAAVSQEYEREVQRSPCSSEERRAEQVERLLGGELLDTSALAYDFDVFHTGAIAAGPGAAEAVRDLALALDHRALLVCRGEGTVWAWIGSRRRTDFDQLKRVISERWPVQISLAIGESAQGLAGWRLTHQQARAALSIAVRSPEILTRYADVALLAAILQDNLLAASLHQLYLAPLERGRDGGKVLRQSLRAYFEADRNASSAAAALGVSRQALARRLRTAEASLGRPLTTCGIELEVSLRFQALHA